MPKSIRTFICESKRILEKLSTGNSLNKPVVYHYTNWEGLAGILQEKYIYITNYRNLNGDNNELVYGWHTLNKLIKNYHHLG